MFDAGWNSTRITVWVVIMGRRPHICHGNLPVRKGRFTTEQAIGGYTWLGKGSQFTSGLTWRQEHPMKHAIMCLNRTRIGPVLVRQGMLTSRGGIIWQNHRLIGLITVQFRPLLTWCMIGLISASELISLLCRIYTSVNPREWIGSALVQIIACRLFGAKPLSEPVLVHCQLDPWEQTSVNFFCQNIKLFIHKNAPYDIVCEMAAILSRGDELNKPQVLCGFVVCMWCAVGVGVRPLQIIYHGVPVLDQNWADYDPVLAHCGIFRGRLFTWHWVCSIINNRCVGVFSHDAL